MSLWEAAGPTVAVVGLCVNWHVAIPSSTLDQDLQIIWHTAEFLGASDCSRQHATSEPSSDKTLFSMNTVQMSPIKVNLTMCLVPAP